MNRKAVSGIMVALLLVGILISALNIQQVKAEPRTWFVDDDGGADFTRIQDAIDVANPGDIVFVYNGTYYENVFVEKSLKLIGESPSETVIDGYWAAIQVIASNVDISNFTLQGSFNGVWLEVGSHGNITGNVIVNNDIGVHPEGSSYNTISGNTITGNGLGVHTDLDSSYNIISENIIANNGAHGVYLYMGSNNTISGNTITNNGGRGVTLGEQSHDTIYGNNITDNDCGIMIYDSFGIKVHHNNFIDNNQQVYIEGSNVWDDGYPSGGNYWSDHEVRYPDAVELDGSGIWDTPYVIDENNQDNYPLMEPWTPSPPIPTTIDELKTELEELGFEGEISNQGIVKSLVAKLNVAQKLVDKGKIDEAKSILEEDFIPQVQNLSGIHITPDAAELLIESVEYILSHL